MIISEINEVETPQTSVQGMPTQEFYLERFLSLFDAFLVRNDQVKAEETLQEAFKNIGEHPELRKRMAMLENRAEPAAAPKPSATKDFVMSKEKIVLVSIEEVERENKIAFLQDLLARIQRNKMRIEV